MSFQELFIDPLAYQFMERAFIAALLMGLICGVVGSYVAVSYTHLRAHET
jgi:ABC-type Mn2+/Zn2+ transport system permease subunit